MFVEPKETISSTKGFTLIEVVFAVFIIAVGVMPSYSIIQNIISRERQSSFHLVATYLAQEGLELVRNKRDNNFLAHIAWNNGLSQCDGSSFYQADYDDPGLGPCGASATPLTIKNGFYCYGGSVPALFTRKIRITPIGSDRLKVSVEVFWKYRNQSQGPVSLQEILYKWSQ